MTVQTSDGEDRKLSLKSAAAQRLSETAARISLDRSDAKITVKQIKLSACTIHTEWSFDHSFRGQPR